MAQVWMFSLLALSLDPHTMSPVCTSDQGNGKASGVRRRVLDSRVGMGLRILPRPASTE